MAVLQPSRSRTTSFSADGSDTTFTRLGPFSSGVWLDTLTCDATADASAVIVLSAVITTSPVLNLDALLTGQSLIQRSVTRVGGVLAHAFVTFTSEHTGPFVLPIGIRLSGGSQFVLVRLVTFIGGDLISVNCSISALELL